jgi:MarR family transcriptional repressor of emrRAB
MLRAYIATMKTTDWNIRYRLENRAGAWALAVADRIRTSLGGVVEGEGAGAALVSLGIYDGLTIERMRHIVGLSHPGAVRLVDRLEADGLVVRGAASDSRAVALHLTARGREAASQVILARERVLERLLAPLSPDEREQLQALLDKLLTALPANRRHLEAICRLDENRQGVCPVDVGVLASER